MTTWCNEDTPLIWGELLHRIAALGSGVVFEGRDTLLEQIMQPAGFRRLQDYLAERPPRDEVHRRRIAAAFLNRYAVDDRMEEEVDLPGWSEDYVEALSRAYDADMEAVARVPGVRFVAP